MCPQTGEFVGCTPLPLWRAEPFEDRQCGLKRRQSLALVSQAPVNLPSGKERSCFFEGHRDVMLRLKPSFERCLAIGELTMGSEQQSPAPAGSGSAPPPAQL